MIMWWTILLIFALLLVEENNELAQNQLDKDDCILQTEKEEGYFLKMLNIMK